jgi:ATP-dependent DNA ligase
MLASSAAQLPKGTGWSYEVKFDGYRTLAVKDGSRVKLVSRNLKDATRLYPAIAREVARLRTESVLLDGEVVAIDEEGRPSFQALHHQAAHTLVYYAFDVLHWIHPDDRSARTSAVPPPRPGSPGSLLPVELQWMKVGGVVGTQTGRTTSV